MGCRLPYSLHRWRVRKRFFACAFLLWSNAVKPYSPKSLKWYADLMFLIPVGIIVAMIAWTIFREFGY